MREANQFGEVGDCVGLEYAFGPSGRGDGPGSKMHVDCLGRLISVNVLGQSNLELRDHSHRFSSLGPLQKIEVRVDQTLLGGYRGVEYANDPNANLANREFVTRLKSTSSCDGGSNQ